METRIRGKDVLGQESGGECKELGRGNMWAFPFFYVAMGWWRKSVLHVGREEILRRQGCIEFEVMQSRRDKDGIRGVGSVCVGWWRWQKVLRGKGGCDCKLFRRWRERRGRSFVWREK